MEPKLLTADRFVDLEAGCSYRYVLSDTEYFRPHYHDYYELFVMLDGSAWHFVNDAKIRIEKGTIVFIRPNDTHDYLCINGKRFSMLNITFTRETAEELFAFLGKGFASSQLLDAKLPPCTLLDEHDLSKLNAQMGSIRAIAGDQKEALKTALRILLFRLFTTHFSTLYTEVTNTTPAWLEELCNKIKQNGNFTNSSEAIYGLSDKSREHISRSMKKYTGMTVSEYVNNLRLQYIINMLDNSNHSIADIIFDSGFGNISWACELFKKRYGMTMSEYRTRNYSQAMASK